MDELPTLQSDINLMEAGRDAAECLRRLAPRRAAGAGVAASIPPPGATASASELLVREQEQAAGAAADAHLCQLRSTLAAVAQKPTKPKAGPPPPLHLSAEPAATARMVVEQEHPERASSSMQQQQQRREGRERPPTGWDVLAPQQPPLLSAEEALQDGGRRPLFPSALLRLFLRVRSTQQGFSAFAAALAMICYECPVELRLICLLSARQTH